MPRFAQFRTADCVLRVILTLITLSCKTNSSKYKLTIPIATKKIITNSNQHDTREITTRKQEEPSANIEKWQCSCKGGT